MSTKTISFTTELGIFETAKQYFDAKGITIEQAMNDYIQNIAKGEYDPVELGYLPDDALSDEAKAEWERIQEEGRVEYVSFGQSEYAHN